MKLFIANISFSLNDEDIKKEFEQYGTVTSAKIIKDRESNRSKGFGFIEMGDRDQGNAAIEGLNGTDVGGRELVVKEAEEKH